MVTITIYGAAGEIGGNKILLEDRDTRVLLDFGASFRARGLYYEEFLTPRAPLGLLDSLVMGLLPPQVPRHEKQRIDRRAHQPVTTPMSVFPDVRVTS